jgi:hypothetical protein
LPHGHVVGELSAAQNVAPAAQPRHSATGHDATPPAFENHPTA